MNTITLKFSDGAENVVQYIADKYHISFTEVIVEAINEYYRDDIEEYERKTK